MTCGMRMQIFCCTPGSTLRSSRKGLVTLASNLTTDTYSNAVKTLQVDAIAGLDAMVPLRRSMVAKRSA
jgi:phage-related protein